MKKNIFKKASILVTVVVIILMIFWGYTYNNKYFKFQDKYLEKNTIDILGVKSDKVLKEEVNQIKYFEIFDNNFKNIMTLEDFVKFPNLEVIVNFGIHDYETEAGKELFENFAKPSTKEYKRYQKMLKTTLPELKNLKEVTFGSRTIFFDLNSFEECSQIEELWIEHNQVENIKGIVGMKNLRILSLSHNKFADLSALKSLEKLEAVNLSSIEVANLQALLDIPSLKLVVYNAKNEEEKDIINQLKQKGVEVFAEEQIFTEILDELKIERIDFDDVVNMNKDAKDIR